MKKSPAHILIMVFLLLSISLPVNANNTVDDETIEEITIEGSREAPAKIDTYTFKTIAGGGNDVLKAIEALPGVTFSGDGAGNAPVIRGSSPIDNQYFVNGVRVGYVFHNDGDSIFNYNLVNNFELYTGAWQPELGNAIGGIISVDLSVPDIQSFEREKNHITILDLGFTRTGLTHAQQVNDNQSFYFSVRESLLFIYIDAFFDDEAQDEEGFAFSQVPRNRDYQFSYNWQLKETMKLEFFASGAKDFIGLTVDEDSDIAQENPDLAGDINVNQNYNNQALILTIEEANYASSWRLNALQVDLDLQFGRALDLDGDVYNNSLIIDYDFSLSNQLDLLVGVDILEEVFDYDVSGRQQPCNDEFQSCPPGFISPIITSKDKIRTQMPSIYTNVKWAPIDILELTLGLRTNYNSYSEKTYLEPRLGIEWFIDNSQSTWLRYGQHHQWFKNYEYAYVIEGFGSDNLDLVKADHSVIGYGQEMDVNWAQWMGPFYWQIEAYYKNLLDLVVANPAAQTDPTQAANLTVQPYINGATGKAWGFEFLLKKHLTEQWQGWLTLAYSKTERYNEITKQSFNFEYDQPFIVNLVSSYQLTPRISLSAKWRYQSGSLYTDIIGANPINDDNGDLIAYDPVEGEINGERYGSNHRLDLRADFLVSSGDASLGWRKPNIVAYVELLNAYGQKNQTGWEYEPDYQSREAEYAFPETVLPSFGMTFTF